jgi:hypothetical protein
MLFDTVGYGHSINNSAESYKLAKSAAECSGTVSPDFTSK